MSYTDPVVTAFEAALESADHVSLLLTAEAASRAASDGSVAAAAAATAVSAAIGYPFTSFDNSRRMFFQSAILGKLTSLRHLTEGPSLAHPRGNFYSWRY